MKIAKEFKWEMGHRLSFHAGKCKDLHGHSYKLRVEFEGVENQNGMVLDYYDVKALINPLIEELDHSCMVFTQDNRLYEALSSINSKITLVEFESTAENICGYFLGKIKQTSLPGNITGIKVRVYETEETYAEEEIRI